MSSSGVRLQMEMIEGWNGASACMLQAALRMSNEAFADHLGISVRTVAGWHQKSARRPRPEMQQLLDTALSQASSEVRERLAALIDPPGHAPANAAASQAATTGDLGAVAEAERRLTSHSLLSNPGSEGTSKTPRIKLSGM
jgi:hypothetical protein